MLTALSLVLVAAAPPAQDLWLAHLLPRPRSVTLSGAWPLTQPVGVEAPPDLAHLGELLRAAVTEAGGRLGPGGLSLRLAIDPKVAEGRPQGCRVETVADGLTLLGSDPEGLRYGAISLRQLLRSGQGNLPQLTMEDWPEILERGFWGGDAAQDLEWLAEHKYNLVEVHAKLGFGADGTPTATMPPELLAQAQRLGIRLVPIIHHLEQLPSTGITKVHPELDAGPISADNAGQRLLRIDHPTFHAVLSKWFSDLGALPGVEGVTVWLSEEGKGHPVADATLNPFVAETRVIEAAFAAARRQHPQLRLRLLTTQASFASNEQVIAAASPDSAIIYYDGSRTYNSGRKPMMVPYFKHYAEAGGWLGVCPQVIPEWRGVAPWHGAEFIQARMRDFAASGVRSLVGYAPPARRFYQFLLEATAEYAWHPESQPPAEFASGYAIRHGLKDPQRFAAWVEALSPVAWDIYGSRIIVAWCYGSSVPVALKGGLKLGQGIFAEFADEQRFEADRERCRQAAELAAGLDDPQLVAETEAIGSWLEMLATYYQLNRLLPRAGQLGEAERGELVARLADFDRHATAAAKALETWGNGVLAGHGTPPGRWHDTIQAIRDEATDMAVAAERVGFPDARKPYRRVKVGSWQTQDFDQQGSIVKELDVTARIAGAGSYEVEFAYTAGLLGLTVDKVVLLTQLGDDPATRREVAVDQHPAHAGGWNKGHLYRLTVDQPPPAVKWLLLASIRAGSPQQPPEARSSQGDIYLRKLD
ncbi:MAG: hypothetical protein HUU35_03135 [Armatimonadetes bacterium]|nr:hypothetical protein [Armatimonadota bacterium]